VNWKKPPKLPRVFCLKTGDLASSNGELIGELSMLLFLTLRGLLLNRKVFSKRRYDMSMSMDVSSIMVLSERVICSVKWLIMLKQMFTTRSKGM